MTTPKVKPIIEPSKACHMCKGTKFWLRDKGYGRIEYVCQICHPCPYTENITWHEVEKGE